MSAPAETRLVRYSPAGLVDAVRSGRIRYPDPGYPRTLDVARTLDGIRRGFPVRRVALAAGEIDLGREATAVIRDDAAGSALRLLARTPAPTLRPPGREPVDLASRRGRMVLHGMASLHPRDLTTGELLDVERTILRDRPTEPANLLLHDDVWTSGLRGEIDALLRTGDPALLASHGIDEVGVQLLRDRHDEAFLERRAAELDRAVLRRWTRGVQPDATARRPVALLFEDSHEQ